LFLLLDKQFKESKMSRRAWRLTSSQVFKELKRCRSDAFRTTSKGLSSQIYEQIGSAYGIKMHYSNKVLKSNGMQWMLPFSVRSLASTSATESNKQNKQE
ncbi:hypothetical protein KI387_019671, partial [Taxus chinensis]